MEKLKVLTFTGDLEKDGYDFKRWRKLTHDYLKNVNTSEKIKLQALNTAIAGNAGIMLSSNSYKSISQIFKALKAAYSHVSNTGKLFNIRQKEDETVGECYARILAEMRRSKNITSKGEEDIGMICLRTALRPEILEKLSNTKFQKLSIMLDVAKQFEADFLENKSKSKTTPTTKNPTKIGTALTLISEEMGLENAESVKKYNELDTRHLPTLYIYSKIDSLISPDEIQKMIDERKQMYPGDYIKTSVFEDAQHVLIFKQYPEKYTELIKEHLAVCKLEIGKTEVK